MDKLHSKTEVKDEIILCEVVLPLRTKDLFQVSKKTIWLKILKRKENCIYFYEGMCSLKISELILFPAEVNCGGVCWRFAEVKGKKQE